MSPTTRRLLGDAGERHARRHLEAKGYVFVAANWRCNAGEVDLAMRDGEELVFVEVKTRRGEGMGRAEEAVSPAQARRLLAAADAFLAEHPSLDDRIWRIDLVAITLDGAGVVRRLVHLENVLTEG